MARGTSVQAFSVVGPAITHRAPFPAERLLPWFCARTQGPLQTFATLLRSESFIGEMEDFGQ